MLMVAVFTAMTGVAYPLLVTAVSQLAFSDHANGSLIERGGEVVGSRLIGQPFTSPEYLHPRPSAAGDGYDPSSSGASNLAPTSPELLAAVDDRAVVYRRENGLAVDAEVPVDAVTASGSGLDPHISIANARLQAARVAAARGLDVDVVLGVIDDHTDQRAFGLLGEPGVNVLVTNLALDDLSD
jgi:K+-transporting ATPase ATPase C chain